MSEEQSRQQEKVRLSALHKLNILDSPFETLFDTIAQVASEVCGTPISLITFVDEDRQWFKANVGLPGITETPREGGFCTYSIMNDGILEVPDATQDDRFWDNQYVTGTPNIRFYAGVPIKLPLGENVGSLCVIDQKPGYLTDHQRIALAGLARIITKALIAREASLKTAGKR